MKVLSKVINTLNSNEGTIRKRLISGAFWSVLGSSASNGINIIAFIILARIISQESYGELGIIRSTLNLFVVAAGMGLGNTATKYIAQYRKLNPKYAGNIYALSNVLSILISIVAVCCLLLLSDSLATNSLKAPHLSTSIKLGAFVLFFTTINSIQSGALNGLEAFKKSSINQILAGVIKNILLLILGFYYGVEGCVVALGIGCILLGLLNLISISQEFSKFNITWDLKHFDKKTFEVIWKFSIPTLLSSLMVIPVLWWAKTILIGATGYAQMAIFDVADQWSLAVIFVPSALSNILLPILSNTLSDGTREQYLKLIKTNLLLNFLIASAIALVIIVASPYLLELYGPEYNDCKPIIFMMIATVCMAICNIAGQIVASQGEMWLGFLFNLIWAIYIILFINLFKQYGALGLSLTLMCSYLLHLIGQIIYIYIKLRKK